MTALESHAVIPGWNDDGEPLPERLDHEILLRAYHFSERAHLGQKRLGQFEEGTRVDAWLYSIVRNAWIDETRARGRRAKVLAPAEAGQNVGHDGAAAANAALEAQDVWTAMQKLSTEQREVIALVCIEGLAYRDAAAQLEIPIGTLTSRLARGREALQALLGETP